MFCKKCGSLLKAVEGKMKCVACSWISKVDGVLRERKKEKRRDVEVVKKQVETNPITKVECPKCGHKEAYYWTMQTRSADEAETIFYKCVKCKHQWRRY